MFKNAGILFVAAIVFAGCSTSKPPEKVIKPVEITGETSALNWTNPAAKNAFDVVVPQPVKPTRPPVAPQKPIPTATKWFSLNEWAAEHHLESPHRLSDLPSVAYAIGSSNGVMVLDIGSREATWNNITVNLGFAPQQIEGRMYLHGLDLQKNLEPLLCEPALKFNGSRIIVIDPGHGGGNTGTHSVLDGRFEKEFTLDTALRLKPLLETNGWTVFLTRTNDTDVANADRVTFATAHHADLYISLHFNATADRNPDTGGIETYCVTPTGMPSTLTRNYSDPLYVHLPANDFDDQNLKLAVRMQTALVRATGLEDRGVCRARFMTVLQDQHCPAVLVEAGYLSNPHEAKLIESAGYRQKLAETIAAALK